MQTSSQERNLRGQLLRIVGMRTLQKRCLWIVSPKLFSCHKSQLLKRCQHSHISQNICLSVSQVLQERNFNELGFVWFCFFCISSMIKLFIMFQQYHFFCEHVTRLPAGSPGIQEMVLSTFHPEQQNPHLLNSSGVNTMNQMIQSGESKKPFVLKYSLPPGMVLSKCVAFDNQLQQGGQGLVTHTAKSSQVIYVFHICYLQS